MDSPQSLYMLMHSLVHDSCAVVLRSSPPPSQPPPPPHGRCTVDEWMAHYRRFLGVSPRTPSPFANSRTSFAFSSGPPSRLQSSRTQPCPQSHMRHKTHPLPSSRPASQLSVLFQGPPCSPSPDPATSNVGLVYGRPSSRTKYVSWPTTSQLSCLDLTCL